MTKESCALLPLVFTVVFWTSEIVLAWLLILGFVETGWVQVLALIFFAAFGLASLAVFSSAGRRDDGKEDKENTEA